MIINVLLEGALMFTALYSLYLAAAAITGYAGYRVAKDIARLTHDAVTARVEVQEVKKELDEQQDIHIGLMVEVIELEHKVAVVKEQLSDVEESILYLEALESMSHKELMQECRVWDIKTRVRDNGKQRTLTKLEMLAALKERVMPDLKRDRIAQLGTANAV